MTVIHDCTFPHDMPLKHILIVQSCVIVETANPDISREYKPGIYEFTNYKTALHLTTVINSANDDNIAILLVNPNKKDQKNDQ